MRIAAQSMIEPAATHAPKQNSRSCHHSHHRTQDLPRRSLQLVRSLAPKCSFWSATTCRSFGFYRWGRRRDLSPDQGKCRRARTDHASGVSRRGVVGNTLRYERNAEFDITPVVSRAPGREGSNGIDVALKDEGPKKIQSSDNSEHSIRSIGSFCGNRSGTKHVDGRGLLPSQ